MTLCITSSCVVLRLLDFLLLRLLFYSLLLNIFHSITALCLSLFSNSQLHPADSDDFAFVTPLHWQPRSTPASPKSIPKCVISSSKDTQCAGASTTSTASTCVPHMASKGTEFRRGLSWLDMLVRSTRAMIKKLRVQGAGTQTPVMAQQAIHHINTPPEDTADETYCLR